ncbi:MAG: hypothetical protein Q4A78_13265 [Peptostreptococcaceae bacterium]|nr:hypothetical protein [Peptostreptococcaceae bacterium]
MKREIREIAGDGGEYPAELVSKLEKEREKWMEMKSELTAMLRKEMKELKTMMTEEAEA